MTSHNNKDSELAAANILLEGINKWLHHAYGVPNENTLKLPSWDKLWAQILVWLQTDQEEKGLPISQEIFTNKQIVKLKSFRDEKSSSFCKTLGSLECNLPKIYRIIKRTLAAWYSDNTGVYIHGHRMSPEQRQNYLRSIQENQPLVLKNISDRSLILGMKVHRVVEESIYEETGDFFDQYFTF
jgi:hypothetical protein